MKKITPIKIFRFIKLQLLIKFGTPRAVADYRYYIMFGKRINWNEPEDINQWINWLAFNTDTKEWSRLSDKYQVREYIEQKGYGNILIPLLKLWNNIDEISLDDLPQKFVLKANNGSGDAIIVRDKKEVQVVQIKKFFNILFRRPFGIESAEPHYLRIKPRIIAEKLLEETRPSIHGDSLIDYKFWCFNGNPVVCFVCSNRTKHFFTIDLYTADKDWNRIDELYLVHDEVHRKRNKAMERPKNLEEMLKIASELSKGFPQIRVDLYEVDSKVFFGELTFTSACGRMNYFNEAGLKMLGHYCKHAYCELKENMND